MLVCFLSQVCFSTIHMKSHIEKCIRAMWDNDIWTVRPGVRSRLLGWQTTALHPKPQPAQPEKWEELQIISPAKLLSFRNIHVIVVQGCIHFSVKILN